MSGDRSPPASPNRRASDGGKTARVEENGGESTDTESAVQTTLTGEVAETDEVIVSAHVGENAAVFPKVLALHVEEGARIADLTCGNLVFWDRVPPGRYDLTATDLDASKSRDSVEGVDCRDTPHAEDSFDAVVLDPPYAAGFFRDRAENRPGTGTHDSFRSAYSSGVAPKGSGKYHRAVLDLYGAAGREARRILRDGGTFIVKVQDEVCANTQELTHIQITDDYEEMGFETIDLFVVVRANRPSVSGMEKQVHARKNHSYFMVYRHCADDN